MRFVPHAVEALMSRSTSLSPYRLTVSAVNAPKRPCAFVASGHDPAMTPPNIFVPSRRRFLQGLGLAAAYFATPGAFAEALSLPPKQTEGPFYPDHLPFDTDNDLIIVNDSLTPAAVTITWVSGRILY